MRNQSVCVTDSNFNNYLTLIESQASCSKLQWFSEVLGGAVDLLAR